MASINTAGTLISGPLSVTSERVFSSLEHCNKKRCVLLPVNISKLAFIKFNYENFNQVGFVSLWESDSCFTQSVL